MTKIVCNKCFGGFGLSLEAEVEYLKRKGFTEYTVSNSYGGYIESVDGWEDYYDRDIPRDDPDLLAVVEELGDKANGKFSDLRVAYIPKGTKYRIEKYDGMESVMTIDDYDWSIA